MAGRDRSGVSLSIVGPSENQNLAQICKSLRLDGSMEPLDVDQLHLPLIRKRLSIALKIDKILSTGKRQRSEKEWYRKAAEEMEIELDDVRFGDSDDDDDRQAARSAANTNQSNQLRDLRHELQRFIDAPLSMSVKDVGVIARPRR